MIESKDLMKDNRPNLATFVFVQDEDDCTPKEKRGIHQELRVIIEDGGAGPYLILKTSRWALGDDVNEFCDMLKKALLSVKGI